MSMLAGHKCSALHRTGTTHYIQLHKLLRCRRHSVHRLAAELACPSHQHSSRPLAASPLSLEKCRSDMVLDTTGLYEEASVGPTLEGYSRVDLLKKIEGVVRELFTSHKAFEVDRHTLGSESDRKRLVLKAVLDQSWSGITEYSQEFYKVLAASSRKQQLQRAFVRQALTSSSHGFDAFDAALLHHASLLSDASDRWYFRWAKTVQNDELAPQLAQQDREGKLPQDLYNHYTIIRQDGSGSYVQHAYATYFPDELGEIERLLDRCIADLESKESSSAEVKEQYLQYLAQYRTALAETQVSMLESQWQLLDEKWMAIKHWTQVVHDIEYGYGDPLRCKVAPDFSIRLLDENFAKENATIDQIQGIMVDYFKQRPGPLAQSGLGALKQSMAGIVYLPFQAATSLYFRFSGQSIPNRSEVRERYGVKIYFDPVSTAAREEDAKALARRMCKDPSRADDIDTVGTIVYHVAAHEIGHAIYGLDAVKDVIKVSTKTLLEEPRAELTALHTLRLLLAAGLVDQALVQKTLASFMLQDLRRYTMFSAQAMWPYTISAMSCWKVADDIGYIRLDSDGKVHIDDSKALAFLEEKSNTFEAILDAEDERNGSGIEKIMQELQDAESSRIVQYLKHELFTKEQAV